MNKLSKLTALLLAIVLALSVPLGAMAEDEVVDTWTEYMDVASEALKTKIMAYETYGEYWDMAKLIEESDFKDFFYTLPLEDQIAIAEYVNGMFWDSLVGFTNVAPLPELVATESASTFRLLARDGEDSSTTSKNIFLEKTATGPDNNGEYTITLESFVTGTVTTTTTTEIKPVDIVLVLDDSGSMDQAFDANSTNGYTYTEVAYGSLDKTKGYYIKRSNGSYRSVTWCTDCEAWTYNCYDRWGDHTSGTEYDNTNTFYERTEAQTKGEALISAVNNFIDSVNANDPTTGTHQMSIVKFSGSSNNSNAASVLNGWTDVTDATVGTLKLTGNDMTFYNGTWINQGLTKAKTQLESLTTTDRQRVVIVFTDGIPGDGSWYNQGGDAESIGVSAINVAKSIKAMQNTTIYTVAVLQGANPNMGVESPASSNNNKINAILHAISSNYLNVGNASSSGSTLTVDFGDLNPKVDTDNDEVVDTTESGYYLTADSPAALNNIFQAISSSIQSGSTTSTLTETTVVKDVMSPYFELPYTLNADGTRNYDNVTVTVTTQKYTGEKVDGARQWETETLPFTPTIEKGHDTETGKDYVTVSNFDFMGNYVADVDHVDPYRSGDTTNDSVKFYGRKLIIQFKVKPTAGFLGGNDVVTNDSSSGIYKPAADSTPENPKFEIVDDFDIPDVDVDLWEIEVVGKHQHIFLSNEADVNELLQSFSLVYQKLKEDGTVDTSEPPYKVNGIRNGYATLEFTLTDTASRAAMVYTIQPGAEVGTWTYVNTDNGDPVENFDVTPFLTDDKEYTISYKVTPKTAGAVTATAGSLDVEVHVYKPTFTFRDTTEKYLSDETAENYYNNNNYVSESWSHTYYDEITVTINVTYDANGTPSYSYVVTSKNEGVDPIYSPAGWDLSQTIDFSGYGSTEGRTYKVTMSGPKPDVVFTYSPVETEWIKEGKVAAVECVPVDVTKVTLTSTNTHDKVIRDGSGAVTGTDTYTTTSVYTEGSAVATADASNNATVAITKDGTTTTKDVSGAHVETLRNKVACEACKTTVETVSTNVNDDGTDEFVIHITDVLGDLIIQKTGLRTGESAIFTATITPPANNGEAVKKYTVVLTGTSADGEATVSVTLADLLANSTYSVVESGDWSWRYTQTNSSGTSGSIVAAGEVTASFTNSRDDQWLDDEVAVKNNFAQNGTGTTID